MMSIREVEQYCKLGDKEEALIQMAYERLGLTARSYHKILKVARTIADLAGSEKIESMHLARRSVIGHLIKNTEEGSYESYSACV